MDEKLFYCNCPLLDGGNFPCGLCNNEKKECNASCKHYIKFKYTCTDCENKDKCEYAFDDYCTDGDCLAIK